MKKQESTLFHLLSCVVKGTAPEASLFAHMGQGSGTRSISWLRIRALLRWSLIS